MPTFPPTSTSSSNSSPLSAAELTEFRTLAAQATSRPGASIASVAKAIGFSEASPLRKILRNPQRTTSRERLELLRRVAGKPSSAAPSGGTSTTAAKAAPAPRPSSASTSKSSTAKSSTGGTLTGQEWVSKNQAQEFKTRIGQLRQQGWTVDTLAPRLGYQHGRSLWKTLASGNVRRRVFDALAALPATPGGASAASRSASPAKSAPAKAAPAKPAPVSASKASSSKSAPAKSAPAARPASSGNKTSVAAKSPARPSTSSAKTSTNQSLRGVMASLESALQHLDLARRDVAQAGTASPLMEPGLRDIVGAIDDLRDRLAL